MAAMTSRGDLTAMMAAPVPPSRLLAILASFNLERLCSFVVFFAVLRRLAASFVTAALRFSERCCCMKRLAVLYIVNLDCTGYCSTVRHSDKDDNAPCSSREINSP